MRVRGACCRMRQVEVTVLPEVTLEDPLRAPRLVCLDARRTHHWQCVPVPTLHYTTHHTPSGPARTTTYFHLIYLNKMMPELNTISVIINGLALNSPVSAKVNGRNAFCKEFTVADHHEYLISLT